ncbi:lysozyme [Caballeronia mineralivorans]|uniref:lysozyme n=1 Tax=Caballeronia mineralivorans TaxID=2010198 RepID=UPI00069E8AEC|nr:lysozyme [Caballeronia mineralivorans]
MNENLKYSEQGMSLTQAAETLYLFAYPDPASPLAKELQRRGLWLATLRGEPIPASPLGLSGAPWTGGWGHTGAEMHYGMTFSREQAVAWLRQDVASAEATVKRVVRVGLNQEEYDALVDLVFNIGSGNFNTSTLLRKLNAGDTEGAIAEFARWNKAGGVVLAGLVKRREANRALFQLGANHQRRAA